MGFVFHLKHELHNNGLQVERAKHERKHYEGKRKEHLLKIEELKKKSSKKEEDVEVLYIRLVSFVMFC